MAMLQQQTLQQTLQQTRTSLLEKKLLFSRIKKLESLPLPSYSLLELSNTIKNGADTDAIAGCVRHDHVLVAQLLRQFFLTYPGIEPESIESVIEMLTPEQIKALSYAPGMLESFGETEEREWNHSYSVKILMESLLADNDISNPLLVLAAFLHDIGKNVFRDWSPKKYRIVESHASSSQNIPLFKIESAVLQTNHAEVGAELLKVWNFPEAVWKPIAQHHNSTVPNEYVFETALLQLVNWIDCAARGVECEQPSDDMLKAAGITEEVDCVGYTEVQKQLIANLRASNTGAIRKNIMNDLIAADHVSIEPQAEDSPVPKPENAPAAPVPATRSLFADDEDAERGDFDPEQYIAAEKPRSMAEREAELLKKMGIR